MASYTKKITPSPHEVSVLTMLLKTVLRESIPFPDRFQECCRESTKKYMVKPLYTKNTYHAFPVHPLHWKNMLSHTHVSGSGTLA